MTVTDKPAPAIPAPMREAFAARARGEVDFIFTVARVIEGVRWDDALAAFVDTLKTEGAAALARIAAARERRSIAR
jgi:hypothetical protein